MRVAFVLLGSLARVSGGFLYDRQLVAGLRARGATVDVIELPWSGYARALARNLAPAFSTRGYDVVIEDELAHPALLFGQRHPRRVALVHNLGWCQPRTRARRLVAACERHYLGGLAGVIAVCASTLADVRATGATAPALIAAPGADHLPAIGRRVLAPRAAESPLRLVFVGIVAPHKGLSRLLPVLARLRELPLRLDVAGSLTADPGHARAVKAAIAAHGLADRVTLHGELDPMALRRLLAQAHVLVMPSDREAYPLAALEGFAAGLPALLTDSGGTGELVGAGADPAGLLLPPDDHWAWARAIAGLATDRDLLARMAQAALARHGAHGTWEETAGKVLRWLEEIRSPLPLARGGRGLG